MNADEDVAALTERVAEAKRKFTVLAEQFPQEAVALLEEQNARLLNKLLLLEQETRI